MVKWRTILLGAVILSAIAFMQGPLTYVSPEVLWGDNGSGLTLPAALLITVGFMAGAFFLISFLYYLFFARGRSFREILQIERSVPESSGEQEAMRFDWKLFSRIVVIEFMLVVVLGYAVVADQSSKYGGLQYKKYSSGHYQSSSPGAPRRYSFVMIRKSPAGRLVSELFFSGLGDITATAYRDGTWTRTEYRAFSNTIPGGAAFLGMGFLLASRFLNRAGRRESGRQLFYYGVHLFLATFFIFPAKAGLQYVMDSLLHFP